MTLKNLDDTQNQIDLKFMKLAFRLAQRSQQIGEVPIGAVIVDKNGEILAKATNLREKASSVLGHAELVALHRASQKLQSWRLLGCTLYVTLEPCLMCAAALVQSRISRVVFATHDSKGGGLGSLTDLSKDSRLNHQFQTTHGVLQAECSNILKNFFKQKRLKLKT